MSGEVNLGISYFGKLPSRGDFLKAPTNNHQLIAGLDQWANAALEALAQDVAWKQLYDKAPALDFALLGSRSQVAIAGHLISSKDESGRRFPFISATSLEVAKPLTFMARSQQAFGRLWSRLAKVSQQAVMEGADAQAILQQLAADPSRVNRQPEGHDQAFQDFLEMQTLGSLQQLLNSSTRQTSVRRILLALGLLLRPVMGAGSSGMGKGLTLPLPSDPMYQSLAACFWLDLIAGFLGRADFRLLVLRRQGPNALLAVSFKGFEPHCLSAMYDDHKQAASYVPLDDPDWVDDHLHSDGSLSKLATYTEHDDLSLNTARNTFRETFLGA